MNQLLCDILSDARNDEITIILLLTRKCPFECAYCFYGCSPRESGSYISDAVLQSAHDFYDELNRLEIKARFNLIGGEPTTNMREFARVFETVTSWYDFTVAPARVEMVTNGWWLHRRETAERFFEILKPVEAVLIITGIRITPDSITTEGNVTASFQLASEYAEKKVFSKVGWVNPVPMLA